MVAVLLAGAGAGLLGCGSGDDRSVPTPGDSGADGTAHDAMTGDGPAGDGARGDASLGDATSSDAPVADVAAGDAGDAGHAGDAGDAAAEGAGPDAAVPSRLLLSYNSYVGASPGELVAFDLASRSVAGRFEYTGAGTTYVGGTAPWLLEQGANVVARLDGARPWVVDSSWSVAPGGDAAASGANPQAVVVAAGSKAYVLPYLSNAISVIDPSAAVDGGLPTKTIDLGALVQDGGDGTLEMTAGAYDPGKHRLYVLLANINQNTYNASTGYLNCAGRAAPSVIAIDTTSDSLVAIDGGAGGAGVGLPGRNPAFGQGAMAFDAVGNRLLVLHGGCTSIAADGGAGPLVGAEVDELSLATGATRVLLDLGAQPLPAQLVYVDATHAFVQVGYGPFTTYAWNPATTALGAAVPNAPDAFAWDGAGDLLGVSARHDADSGSVVGFDIVSVRVADGTLTRLASDPFSLTGGGVTGAQLWPAPQ
jgi:hypothetical protein